MSPGEKNGDDHVSTPHKDYSYRTVFVRFRRQLFRLVTSLDAQRSHGRQGEVGSDSVSAQAMEEEIWDWAVAGLSLACWYGLTII